jgi:hypothetical protein
LDFFGSTHDDAVLVTVFFPAVFKNGDVTGVGPSLLALVPLMCRPVLQFQNQPIMDLVLKLLHMLSRKDSLALQVFLNDCLNHVFEICTEIYSNKDVRTDRTLFCNFAQLLNVGGSCGQYNSELSSSIRLEDNKQRVLMGEALCSMSIFVMNTMGQTLSDSADNVIWRNLCTNLVRGTMCENREINESVSLMCLRILLSLCTDVQLPRLVSEQVRPNNLHSFMIFAS